MNQDLLQETPPKIANFITKRMHKEIKRFKTTEPFHARRSCQDNRCVWHVKRGK